MIHHSSRLITKEQTQNIVSLHNGSDAKFCVGLSWNNAINRVSTLFLFSEGCTFPYTIQLSVPTHFSPLPLAYIQALCGHAQG